MASIRRRGENYYVRWMGGDGRQHERKSGRDHATAKALARKLESEAARERAGLVHSPRWDGVHAAIDSYVGELEAKDRDLKHRRQCRLYLTRVVELGGIKRLDDLDKAHVLRALGKLREQGLSARTLNSHLNFARSLAIHVGRPLVELKGHKANEQADRRLVRRALTGGEVTALLKSLDVPTGKRRIRLTPRDRRMLYWTALATGYRKSELGSLPPSAFKLDVVPPTIDCEAKYTKNRQPASQPIPSDLAVKLREYLADKPSGSPVWPISQAQHVAEAVRKDMEAAGLDPSQVDLHAFRHTFCTNLALANVPPAILQKLARHHSLDLTVGIYTHLGRTSAWECVDRSLFLIHPYGAGGENAPGSAPVGGGHKSEIDPSVRFVGVGRMPSEEGGNTPQLSTSQASRTQVWQSWW